MIYIHLPFCRQACTYCDFHFSTSLKLVDEMIASVRKELLLRSNYAGENIVETIYFGGGTPSLIATSHIESIISLIRNEFDVAKDAEITLEANPDDLSEEKSGELLRAGVNRLSIGIQSFSDADLSYMNRAHSAKQALLSIDTVKEAGFTNISIDLIYGIPVSPEEQWQKNMEIAFNSGVDHLSCYALTVEPRTVLADLIRKKRAAPVEDEKTISEFNLLMSESARHGFEQYEISNFARGGKYSRHNTSYWQGKKYLGAGPSAHSYDGNSRQWNIPNNNIYVSSIANNIVPFEKEILSEENKFNEYILVSLRTMWGTDVLHVENFFGEELKSILLNKINQLIKDDMIIFSENKITLTQNGKLYADKIAGELFI